jgi:hypothetical protein
LRRVRGVGLFLLALAFILALGLRYVRATPATGDEVEYLLLAQSLWREHDLDLADNFARGDHLEYTHDLREMPYGTWRADGRPVSTHSVGLPLALAPVYAAGGRAGCVAVLALCAAAAAALVRRHAAQLAADDEAGLLAFALVAGPPLFFYGFHVYTEAPSALLAFAAFVLLRREGGAARAVVAAVAVSALGWLHVKMIPAAIVLGFFGVLRQRGASRVAFAAVVGLCAAAYGIHHYAVFGDPSPLSLYGSKVPRKVQRSSPWLGLPGLMLDGAFGLLPVAPGFVLGLAGLGTFARRLGRDGAWGLALLAALLLPVLFWRTWWGGFCPPARFLVPMAPFLAVAAACRVAVSRQGLARARWPLAAWGIALALYASARPERRLLLAERTGPAPLFEALRVGGMSPNDLLPRLTPGAMTPWRAAAWTALLAAALALDARARCRGGSAPQPGSR